MIDNQYLGAISTRKLVIETAMLNVITAYGAQEAIETMQKFSAVDGIVLDTDVEGMPCKDLIAALRRIRPEVPIITVSPNGYNRCDGEQHHVSSYDPRELLTRLQEICPKETIKAAEEGTLPPG